MELQEFLEDEELALGVKGEGPGKHIQLFHVSIPETTVFRTQYPEEILTNGDLLKLSNISPSSSMAIARSF